ncbi:hypothetical protein GN109_07800 [Collimonas pratensis]|nr:hypothetical protein [Collimonas pratensis]
MGIAIIPALQQRMQVSTIAYRKIDSEEAYFSIWMVFRRHQQNALTRDFIKLVRTELST